MHSVALVSCSDKTSFCAMYVWCLLQRDALVSEIPTHTGSCKIEQILPRFRKVVCRVVRMSDS
jgi:hypothetical protein